eukprot:scaffold23626_cov60-Phaeocystis_antarctica.AAC.2
MELLKNAYGPSHHEYATAMNNVATLFQALGRLGLGLGLGLGLALALTLTLTNVATLFQALGRYAEAEPLLLEASRIQVGRPL